MSRNILTVFAIVLVSHVVLMVAAKEPGWTDEERAERSDAVFVGQVESLQRIEELNDREMLNRAVIRVVSVSKNASLVGDGQIAVYYLSPKTGDASGRCPTYVSLDVDQKATFYLRVRKIGIEWRAFLDMGSDVRPVANEEETQPPASLDERRYPS